MVLHALRAIARGTLVACTAGCLSTVAAQAGPSVTRLHVDPPVVDEGGVVAFDVAAEHPENHPLRFAWSYGDGSEHAPDPHASRTFTTYADDGSFDVVVTVEDASGRTATAQTRVTVRNVAPQIERIDRAGAAIEQTEQTFHARAHDPGEDALAYTWDFGDGTILGPSSDLAAAEHAYERAGTYTIVLTVDDGDGGLTTWSESIVVGAGFRYRATGALGTGGDQQGESPYLLGLPLVMDGEVLRFAGDLGAAAQGAPAADPDALCLVAFGSRVMSIRSALEEGVTIGFTGVFPGGLREGTYPVAVRRNQVPFPVHDALELEWASPNTFFAHAGTLGNIDGVPESMDFHGTGGSVTVHAWEEGRVEISFSAGLEEAQGPLDVIDGPGGATLPPPAIASVQGTFQHEIQRSIAGGSGSMNPLAGSTYGDWYLCAPRAPLQVEEVVPRPEGAGEAEAVPPAADAVPRSSDDAPVVPRDVVPTPNDVPLIPFEDPEIAVRFSQPIHLDSAVENVVLEWRRADGAFQGVPILVLGEGDRTLRLSPLVDLMDGVVYRARVEGGLEGVQGRSGETLAEDEEWLFETILDLGEDRHGVTLATTQVARDAPLVADKSTETRVYVNWRAKPHVHPEWQTRQATFDITVDGADTGVRRVRVKRMDLYGDRERKHALDSVNFYGWRPSAAASHDLTARVTQIGQGDAPQSFEGTWTAEGYGAAPSLVFDYWFVATGPWETGVPPAAEILGHRIAHSGATFTAQTFPVPAVIARYRGTVTVVEHDRARFAYEGQDYLVQLPLTFRDEPVVEEFAQGLGATDADVVVAFMPPEVMNRSGHSYSAFGTEPRVVAVQVDTGMTSAEDYFGSTIAHEIGHAFGLEHNSNCNDVPTCAAQSSSDPIEGTRIAAGGTGGWNKSRWSGNEQASQIPGAVLSLMYGSNLHNDLTFITNDDYLRLQDAMRTRGQGSIEPAWPAERAAWLPPPSGLIHVQRTGTPGRFVSGWIDTVGGRAVIDSVRAGGGAVAPHVETGDAMYVLESRSAKGIATGRVAVSVPTDSLGHAPEWFGDILPFHGFVSTDRSTATIVLLRDGAVIAEQRASESVPRVALEEDRIDLRGTSSVRWEATDADGDALRFDLEYAPDGRDWRPLAVGLREATHDLLLDAMVRGTEPMLRVTASDGFHATSVTARLLLPPSNPWLGTFPADGAEADVRTSIEAWASAPTSPAAFELTLIPAGGATAEPVQGDVVALAGGLGLRFVPREPLRPVTGYRATLASVQESDEIAPLSWTFTTGPSGPARVFQARNLAGGALASATQAPDQTGAGLPGTCGGISAEVWAPLIPEGATDVEALGVEDGCRISLVSDRDPQTVRAFAERAIIANRFFLTSNRSDDTGTRIGMRGHGVEGEAMIEHGPPTALTWILRRP